MSVAGTSGPGGPDRSRPRLTALAGQGDRAGWHDVARIRLAAGEWMLAQIPAGLPAPGPARVRARVRSRELARQWSSGHGGVLPARFAIVRVPADAIDPLLGLAVLHHRPAGTVVYCPEGQITDEAAESVGLLAAEALRQAAPAQAGVPGALAIRLTRVEHTRFTTRLLHPAFAERRGRDLTAWVCADQISEAAAAALSALCAAHSRCGYQPTLAACTRSDQPVAV